MTVPGSFMRMPACCAGYYRTYVYVLETTGKSANLLVLNCFGHLFGRAKLSFGHIVQLSYRTAAGQNIAMPVRACQPVFYKIEHAWVPGSHAMYKTEKCLHRTFRSANFAKKPLRMTPLPDRAFSEYGTTGQRTGTWCL